MATTVRLPLDDYRECAVRAAARNWSMSDYIGYCVARELDPKKRNAKVTNRLSPNSTVRVFDDETLGIVDATAINGFGEDLLRE